MKYVFHEPSAFGFRNVNGHSGKYFGTNSLKTNHLIVECDVKLTVSLVQNKTEFNYYILAGQGYFTLNNDKQKVIQGDLVVIPPGTKYTFEGKLRMLLINTPHWSKSQEDIIKN